MLGCLSADIICSEKLTVSFKEQIMSRDKYLIIYFPQMEHMNHYVDYPSTIFRNKRGFEISLGYFPVLAEEYPVTWRI